MVSNLPYAGSNTAREIWVDRVTEEPGDAHRVDYRRITPEYFETMRIPLLAGRVLQEGDRRDTQAVAVVSRSLSDRYWPGLDPIGRPFRLSRDGDPITVVGVVADIQHDWFLQRRAPTVYRALAQEAPFAHAFVVRTVGDPLGVAGDFRRAVAAADADQPVLLLDSMEGHFRDRTAGVRFVAEALGVVAGIAFVLAVTGLYGLIAFMVSRRTQELGVRMALGATEWQIIRVTAAHGLRITTAGLLAGALAALATGRAMETTLFGVVSGRPWQLVTLVAVVAGVCLLASYIPARRTARLDPTIALRAE
jgi:putative ABC transport system permease protein